jgi:hypothetical protein
MRRAAGVNLQSMMAVEGEKELIQSNGFPFLSGRQRTKSRDVISCTAMSGVQR